MTLTQREAPQSVPMNGSTPSSSPSAPTRRLHALDNLRATMMWLGIVLHVSVLYMSRPSPLPWHDDRSSPWQTCWWR